MDKSNEFMLVFRFAPTISEPTAEVQNEIHQQWKTFIADIASQGKLISTHRLSFDGLLLELDQETQNSPFVANNQMVSGNLMLKASSYEEAAKMAKNCPVLKMGGSVEVRQVIPMN